jgi:membrane protease YdiL (CAAX protease family)
MAQSTLNRAISAPCWNARYLESRLMDALDPASPALTVTPAPHQPRILGFWGTTLWGIFIFAALFVGQIAVVAYFVLWQDGPIDINAAIRIVGRGLTISLSVIMGLPAVVLALWIAIRGTRTPFADYLGLRSFSWKNLALGIAGLVAIIGGWDLMSRTIGHEVEPGFMLDVLKSARDDGALWVLILAFCVAAPVSEELFARGFLYRGWSESFLQVPGSIMLSSLVWTGLHLQYDWYFFGEVFCLGLWFGYLRYRSHSTWLTILLHGLNNFGAVVQGIWLAGHS